MTEALKEARATTKSSVVILLDLSAAFDTVNLGIFLSLFTSIGIAGRAHAWFESYLTGQSFKVSWLGHTSAAHLRVTGTSSLCHIKPPHWARSSDHMAFHTTANQPSHPALNKGGRISLLSPIFPLPHLPCFFCPVLCQTLVPLSALLSK